MKSTFWDKSIGDLIKYVGSLVMKILRIFIIIIYLLIVFSTPIFLLYKWNFGYAEQINTFLSYSIWPLTVIFIIAYFQQEIRNALNNMTKARTPMFEVEFSRPNEQIKEASQEKGQAAVLKRKIESPNYKEEIERLKSEATDSTLKFHFEKTYRLIFGSQLAILNLMGEASDKSLTSFACELIHKKSSYSNTYPFEDYMGFLINMALVQHNPSLRKYYITNLGYLFLGYIKTENLSTNKIPY